jgi:hypothetical protein
MALGTIPPWLQPPNFLGAMREGAELGLSQRRQDTEESQTADRLKLAYQQLGAKERMAAAATQARQAQAQAALELRRNFLDLAMRGAAERERHNRALEGHARTAVSELQKFDIGDTKKKLAKVSEELRNDPAWTDLATMEPGSTKYKDMVKSFNVKQATAQLFRDKLKGMGKEAEPALTYSRDSEDYVNQNPGEE